MAGGPPAWWLHVFSRGGGISGLRLESSGAKPRSTCSRNAADLEARPSGSSEPFPSGKRNGRMTSEARPLRSFGTFRYPGQLSTHAVPTQHTRHKKTHKKDFCVERTCVHAHTLSPRSSSEPWHARCSAHANSPTCRSRGGSEGREGPGCGPGQDEQPQRARRASRST